MAEATCPECGDEFDRTFSFYQHWNVVHEGEAPVISKDHRDEEYMRELYEGRGLSQQEMADEIGVSRSTVKKWMKRHGIEASRSNDPEAVLRRRCEVDEETGCWEWTGYIHDTGYGNVSIEGENWQAHRLSYKVHNGEIPDGAYICHKCHNPPCVNPDHLYAGNPKTNAQDAIENGDWPVLYGESQSSAELAAEDVKEIRRKYDDMDITQRELAEEYGTTRKNITHIVNRNSWTHI